MSDHIKYDTPLLKKIGFKSGQQILISGAPDSLLQILSSESIYYDKSIKANKSYDLVWLYTNQIAELEVFLKKSRKIITAKGMIWVSWYKKASKKQTEINEDIIRSTALALDLVDIKVASVDDTWSALKMVIPLKSR